MIDIDLVTKLVESQIIFRCPKDSRNLVNSERNFIGADFSAVMIGGEMAKYMPFTNEPWISAKWHGRKNPNESWWDKTLDDCMDVLEGADCRREK